MKKRISLIFQIALIGTVVLFTGNCKKDNVEPQMPILSTIDVAKIGQITAISGGVISSDEGFAITSRGVCWNTAGNPTIADPKTADGLGAGTFISKLTGLIPGTTYYVRAYATNSQGTKYGSTMVFQTLGNTFTDNRDGNVYKMITIGNQIWMAENLRYLPIIEVPATGSRTKPYYYVHGYNGYVVSDAKATVNYITYGVLYNWVAAMARSASSTTNPSGVKGVCPVGWHLPSDDEWAELMNYLGGTSVAGGKLKESGIINWHDPNLGATNETGFTALPGGCRHNNATFANLTWYGYWWSATEASADEASIRNIHSGAVQVSTYDVDKEQGLSVRCIKD